MPRNTSKYQDNRPDLRPVPDLDREAVEAADRAEDLAQFYDDLDQALIHIETAYADATRIATRPGWDEPAAHDTVGHLRRAGEEIRSALAKTRMLDTGTAAKGAVS